jgi:hypothetical protein
MYFPFVHMLLLKHPFETSAAAYMKDYLLRTGGHNLV